jgi:zinc protease
VRITIALLLCVAGCASTCAPGGRRDYMNGPGDCRVLVEENHDLPIVRATITLRTGGADDAPELDGLANFATELMARGAAGKSRAAIDEAFDSMGTALTIHTEYDGAHFEVTVLRDRLEAAMALLADVVLRPDFPTDEADKLRREIHAQIDELRDDDSQLARRFLARRLFGDHPYGRTLTGTDKTLARCDAAAARAWHAAAVRGPGVIVSFAGDIDPERAGALVSKHLGTLPPGDAAAFGRPYAEPVVRKGTRLTIVDKPERSQSQILFAHVAPNWRDADFDALAVATHTFGGTFTSRLMDEVRSKRGLSYGASARLGQGRGQKAFTVNVFPSLEQTAETIALVRGLLDELVNKGQPEAAIEFGRQNLRESFAFHLATPEDRLDLRLTAELAGLPPDYIDRYGERVSAVQPAQANAAVARRLRPADLEIIVVATEAELRPRLEAAGLLKDVKVEIAPYDAD